MSRGEDVLTAVTVAFDAVFALFVAGIVGLAFFSIRWGLRRDRAGRRAWQERQREAADQDQTTGPVGRRGPFPPDGHPRSRAGGARGARGGSSRGNGPTADGSQAQGPG